MRMLWCFNIKAKEGVEVPLKDGESPDISREQQSKCSCLASSTLDTFDGPMPATRGPSMPVQLEVRDAFRQKIIDEEYESECSAFADVVALGTL